MGSIEGGALLRPDTPPAPPRFLRPSTLGGAKVLPSPSSLPAAGMGVALDSEVLSTELGGGIDGEGSALGAAIVGLLGGLSCGKRARRSDGRRSVITLLFFADLDEALAVGVDMAGDVVDGGVEQVLRVDGMGDGVLGDFGWVANSRSCPLAVTCSSKPSSDRTPATRPLPSARGANRRWDLR